MLKECLQSILNQSFADFEIIVGNDYTQQHLTYNTIGVKDSRIRIINNAINLGELNNMNALLAASQGRYFTWLADDDMYMPHYLSTVRDALLMFDFTKVVFTSYSQGDKMCGTIVKDQGGITCISGQQFLSGYLSNQYKAIGCYGVFNAKYLKQIGGMEQLGDGFSPYSDNLLAIRAGMLNKVVYINRELIFFRIHDQSLSSTSGDVKSYSSAQRDLFKKYIEMVDTTELENNCNHNTFRLINLFILHFFEALKRSEQVLIFEVFKYFVFIIGALKFLKTYRVKTVFKFFRNIKDLIKHWISKKVLLH